MVHLLKINYYPPCPCPDLVLGVPAHSDMCFITLLVPNDVQGLQASRDEHWYDVKYVPSALVIHIGDQMEVYINVLRCTCFFEYLCCFSRPYMDCLTIKKKLKCT